MNKKELQFQRRTTVTVSKFGGKWKSAILLSAILIAGQRAQGQAVRPGFSGGTLLKQDDVASTAQPLGFSVNYFGTTFSSVFITDNGYITFDGQKSDFTPEGLRNNIRKIIAPFFADVDPSNPLSFPITWGQGVVGTRRAFAVNWVNVGYFQAHADKLNSFQLVLIDRSDRLPGDFDFEFNYNQIAWEVGDVNTSGGGGICGSSSSCSPPSVGYSNGLSGVANVSFELGGSHVPGAFLDTSVSALRSQQFGNSGVPGRFAFQVRNGIVNGTSLAISTTSPLPAGQANVNYSLPSFTATGGTPAYAWSVGATSTLPPGLTLNPNGSFSGVPTAAGTYSFDIKVSDQTGASTTAPFSLIVNPPPAVVITVSPSALSGGTVGVPISQNVTATGGTGPYTFSQASGSLPPGLTLSTSGLISGTPLSLLTSAFTIVATDSQNHTGSRSYSIAVTAPVIPDKPGISITTRSIANGAVGADYLQTLGVTGGSGKFTWSVDPTSLPPGIGFSNSGVLSGKPTRAGNFSISVSVTDTLGSGDGTVFPITITGPPLSVPATTLANGTVGVGYSGSVQATGGVTPYIFSISGGSLPAGLSLGADGKITGTPTAAGASNFTVQVTDAAQNPQGKATGSFSITVLPSPPVITTTSLSNGVVNSAYTSSVAAAGGTLPYTFSVSSGSLPDGVTLSPGGSITGMPTVAGNFSVTVQVTDKLNQTAAKAFSVKIAGLLSITTNSALPVLVAGTTANLALSATGGTLPYVWSITGGSLAAGLSFDSATGQITGRASAAGNYSFTATVTDANNLTASKSFTGRITTPIVITTGPVLPPAIVGAAFTQAISATGGTPPYRFAADGLAAGLTISAATGTITGTPTAVGTSTFGVTVTDSDALSTAVRSTFTLAVNLPQVSAVTIGGVPDTAVPAQQPAVTLSLDNTFPLDISGSVALTFAPDVTVPDDPTIQFSNGKRTADFTIPAGTKIAVFRDPGLALQTGTVAGTITLTTTLQAAGGTVTCNCSLTRTIRIPKGAPVIVSVKPVRGAGGISIAIIGYSTTRELTQAAFQFSTTTGSNVQTTSFTVPISSVATTWFQSAPSVGFGSQFLLTVPFTIQGDTNAVTSVSVTLSNANSPGTSQAVSAAIQ